MCHASAASVYFQTKRQIEPLTRSAFNRCSVSFNFTLKAGFRKCGPNKCCHYPCVFKD